MRLGAAGGKTVDPKLGYFRAETVAELDSVVEKLDIYGLSAIASPVRTIEMSDDECIEFGEKAASLGVVISEVHFLSNLHAPDRDLRSQRIEEGRSLLRKADLMGARCSSASQAARTRRIESAQPAPTTSQMHSKRRSESSSSESSTASS
jgi:sugar phosphate isomerase/epimerase